ncbi:MAG: glycosyltransferase family 2 protein [Candidatus Electrothrix scaldis]|nr:MAG: glycosyltransferase family 2 protein [Candidatus Electrothrix sp. GW3-3]
MKVSLIITTYNWKDALELSLLSGLQQKHKPVEIVVADDGSRADTGEMIAGVAARAPFPVIHSWQEDEGFRLSASRNKAIAKTSGEYIVLIDGDIIMEKHFIADHVFFAQQGCFVQGTRVLLKEGLSEEVLARKKMPETLCKKGVENRKNCLRSSFLSRLVSFKNRGMNGVRTCNFAFWRKDALAVNGFNEDFIGWGREDSEFTARLLNYGLIRRSVKFNALAYHLYHPRNDRSHLPENDRLLQDTIEQKKVWCEKGVNAYL